MLENKVVKVSNPQILQFFHPNAVLRDELTILDRDRFVIYTGETHNQIKKWLSDRTSTFISTVGPYEVDLTNPIVLLDTVAEARGGKVPQRVKDLLEDLDLEDVESIAKIYWVSGKWLGESDKCEKSIYDLYVDSVDSKVRTLDDYFKLREVYTYSHIKNSYMTFLVKCYTLKGFTEKNEKSGYKSLCEKANRKFTSKRIKDCMVKLGGSDNEMSFLHMLMEL